MRLNAIDVGGERDVLAQLDALLRVEGWRYLDAHVRERVERTMQRIVQPDCSDRERAELAGEVRGLTYVIEYPRNEANAIMERLA